MLGKIVERISRQAFTRYVTAHVIRALGIADEDLCYTVRNNARHSTGYLEEYSLANALRPSGVVLDATGGI